MDIKEALNAIMTQAFSYACTKLVPAILIFLISEHVSKKVIHRIKIILMKNHLDENIIYFLNSIFKFFIQVVIALVTVPMILNIDLSVLITTFGASLIAIIIYVKNDLANIMSGFVIIFNKPFGVGDFIETEKIRGTVTKIEMLFTTLEVDDKEIIVPNSMLTSSYVIKSTK